MAKLVKQKAVALVFAQIPPKEMRIARDHTPSLRNTRKPPAIQTPLFVSHANAGNVKERYHQDDALLVLR
tara:strand:- start:8428 stop:8637 length:210 start_codon:yes stop_codon:yes gene_type:complete